MTWSSLACVGVPLPAAQGVPGMVPQKAVPIWTVALRSALSGPSSAGAPVEKVCVPTMTPSRSTEAEVSDDVPSLMTRFTSMEPTTAVGMTVTPAVPLTVIVEIVTVAAVVTSSTVPTNVTLALWPVATVTSRGDGDVSGAEVGDRNGVVASPQAGELEVTVRVRAARSSRYTGEAYRSHDTGASGGDATADARRADVVTAEVGGDRLATRRNGDDRGGRAEGHVSGTAADLHAVRP